MGRTVMIKKHLALWVISILIVSYLGGCGNQYGNAVIQGTVAEDIDQEVLDEEITKEEGTEAVEYVSSMAEVTALGLPENMLAYWLVLHSKIPFISANEGCQEFYWDEYFWCLSEPDPMFTVYDFSIVDLDNDGIEELVMTGFPETTQVLDYQEGRVYSYQFVYRGMKGICTNGVYNSSSAYNVGGFHRIVCFDKGTYEEETLAYMNENYFEIEGVEVSSEEFFAYAESLAKAEQIESMDFTEEMLDKILLGDLEEEKLSRIKHVETVEICDENNLKEANVPEPYLAVLTGNEKFICVTEKGQEFIIDGNCIKNPRGEEVYEALYISMADMEGDGEDEVVLTCAGKTLILHAIEDVIYGYAFEFRDEMGAMTEEGVFKTGYPEEDKYGKIVSFDKDECRIEIIENHENVNSDRMRYYYFSGIFIPHFSYDLSSLNDGASLVLLNQARDDIQLYGITLGTASAMILYVDGEKVFLDHSFRNFYMEYPRLYCGDLDNDGREEIAISYRTATGNPGSWYGLSVCDYEDGWKVWDYDSWQQDVEAMIHYRWDEASRTMLFLNESGSVLTEIELPEWTENHPYTGKVDFGNDIHFSAEKMKLEVEPWILLENSLPYDPIVILFDVHYENGGFTIEVTDILDCKEYYNQGGIWN